MIEITKETSGQSDVELIVLNGKKWLTEWLNQIMQIQQFMQKDPLQNIANTGMNW